MTNPETSSDLVAQTVWDDIVEGTAHLWAGDTVMDVLTEEYGERSTADKFAVAVKHAIATTIERLTAERDEARADRDSHQRVAIRTLEDAGSYKASMKQYFKRALTAESLAARQAEALKAVIDLADHFDFSHQRADGNFSVLSATPAIAKARAALATDKQP